jgi:YesN/AraC family two-component response regulator
MFIRPDQVHRLIAFEDAFISTSIITEDNIRAEYLNPLQNLAPLKPLAVTGETMAVLSQTAALCVKLSEKKEEKLYHAILQESCQTLVAIVVSQYLATAEGEGQFSRAGEITRSFKAALERDFREIKTPAAYADGLHISTSYLNECVKSVTGKSVSAHIQQRVILEAKRMLYHSNRPIKVIAAELGYDDHSYFIRLFVKLTGSTPVVFRDKNRE